MGRLTDKVAIITGAASGMGLAGAQLFAREGAKVVMTDVSADALETESAALKETGAAVLALPLNVADEAAWAEVVAKTVAEFGKVDILVNNAGVHKPLGVLETTEKDWDFVMDINAKGVWLGMKAVIPQMQAAGGGSIVNVSSIAAFMGGMQADGGGMAYSASKGAVRSVTKHVAQMFAADNIRANTIHPGPIYTGMAKATGITKEQMGEVYGAGTPIPPHVGDPEDIGYGMLYLASDESKFVTGEELVIDGGSITH
ncbi:SDR family NAD(P)-dependent oxidoreductase [Gulosibacter molinativorax]|uniref:3-oxoacyl-ACP reductase n=1 Tax=Gulosibacter molinativorax TaxID=256821 RepID=A0ABT7C9W6_9MICO|nr:glucose 1-dehydrogenase [Gulosibacter molinativorax]MDJ1371431.1 3-oxoacyl-ACP reductase [Gulosibacter molinativorax]QUY62929.1 Cyclopentanol dehydrogenase [Gulosibacter molinativorax]